MWLALQLTCAWAFYLIEDVDISVVYMSTKSLLLWGMLDLTSDMYLMSSNGSVAVVDYNRFYDHLAKHLI